MITAEVMSRDLVTIRDDQSVDEAAQVLLDEEITGLPVVDRRGRLVGVVSLVDLVASAAGDTGKPTVYRDLWASMTRRREHIRAMDETARVRDVMSDRVITVDEMTRLEELVELMLEKDIHRVIVVREGMPVGIVTTTDLIRLVPRLLKVAAPL